MQSCFPKMTAVLGFSGICKFLFFPSYNLFLLGYYSSAKLDSTLPLKCSTIFPSMLPLLMLLISPIMSLPSSLPSESRSAGTYCPFHTLSNPCTGQLPAQFLPSTSRANASTKVSLACLIFSSSWPHYLCIFKGRRQTYILTYFNIRLNK